MTKSLIGQDLASKLVKLPSFINSPTTDEIAPILTWDGETIYFTRIKDPRFEKTLYFNGEDLYTTLSFDDYIDKMEEIFISLGDEPQKDLYKSTYNQDIFVAKKYKGHFSRLIHPGHPLNSALPNSVCAIMPDQTTLVLLNQFYKNGSMYKGFSFAEILENDQYDFPQPLFINGFEDNIKGQSNLCLSRNGELMVIASAKEGDTNTDLYVSIRLNTDTYSPPIRLEGGINTDFREFSPTLSEDGKFLFFSSTRDQKDQNSDIYVSVRLDNTYLNWSKPKKLGSPINSQFNEGHPFVAEKKLYFCSDRDGSWDIFYYDFKTTEFHQFLREIALLYEVAPELEQVAVTKKKKSDLSNRGVELPKEPKPKPAITDVRVKVVNSKTLQPIATKVMVRELDKAKNTYLEVSNQGFVMNANKFGILIFEAQIENYIAKPHTVNIKALLDGATAMPEVIIKIDPIEVDSRISIDPIYFNKGKDRILTVSYPEMQRLVNIMKTHKSMNVLIEGHTDNFGDAEALRNLSDKRAYSVKLFLVSQGIAADRIKTKGYGKARPITDNSNEFNKAKNRRVEIVITKI